MSLDDPYVVGADGPEPLPVRLIANVRQYHGAVTAATVAARQLGRRYRRRSQARIAVGAAALFVFGVNMGLLLG